MQAHVSVFASPVMNEETLKQSNKNPGKLQGDAPTLLKMILLVQ